MADATQPDASLGAYQRYLKQVLSERGFDDETVSQKFMLLLEQGGEFAKSARARANLAVASDAATDTLSEAAADMFTILIDICNQLGLDLEKAFIERERENANRTWE